MRVMRAGEIYCYVGEMREMTDVGENFQMRANTQYGHLKLTRLLLLISYRYTL